jgi:hypothetical protein
MKFHCRHLKRRTHVLYNVSAAYNTVHCLSDQETERSRRRCPLHCTTSNS